MMKTEQLLVTESDRVEWKETEKDQNDIFHAVCALANDLGNTMQPGYLVIGVAKDGLVVGIDAAQLDNVQQTINNRLTSTKILPTPSYAIEVRETGDKDIVVVTVNPYPVPPIVSVNQTIWVRKGSSTVRAREADIIRLKERRPENNQPFDIRIWRGAGIEDIDTRPLRTTYESQRGDDDDPETFPSFEVWMTQQQLGRAENGVWTPNPTCLLVHGIAPQTFFPGAIIELVRYGGRDVDGPILFRKTISGPLSFQLDAVWSQLSAHIVELPDREDGIRMGFSADYPLDALKELARNMVQHRLYEGTNAPGRIEWYEDRIELSNPGGPFGHASEGEFGELSDYRNPLITARLADLGYVQRLGRGFRRVRSQLDKNGNPPPEVKTDGFTRIIVRGRA